MFLSTQARKSYFNDYTTNWHKRFTVELYAFSIFFWILFDFASFFHFTLLGYHAGLVYSFFALVAIAYLALNLKLKIKKGF